MELRRKKELIQWLDDKDQRSGFAETISDVTIRLAIDQIEKRVWPLIPEAFQEIINTGIDALLDSDGATTKDGGETPPDPDPDK